MSLVHHLSRGRHLFPKIIHKSRFSTTSHLPSSFLFNHKNAVMLSRLPETMNYDSLKKQLTELNCKDVHIQPGMFMYFSNQKDADAVKGFVASQGLQTNLEKISVPSLVLRNLAINTDIETVRSLLKEYQPVAVAELRENSHKRSFIKVNGVLHSELLESSMKTIAMIPMKKPALFVRDIRLFDEDQIHQLFSPFHPIKIHFVRKTPDGPLDLSIVEFRDQSKALHCLKKLKDTRVDDHRPSIRYQEFAESCVSLLNLSEDVSKEDIYRFSGKFPPQKVQFIQDGDRKKAILQVNDYSHGQMLVELLDGRTINGSVVSASISEHCDYGLVVFHDKDKDAKSLLDSVANNVQEVVPFEGKDFRIVFRDIASARQARAAFLNNLAENSSNIGSVPQEATFDSTDAFAVELSGLDIQKDATSIIGSVHQALPDVQIIDTNRFAMIRFRRAKEVVPGMKKLKQMSCKNNGWKVARHRSTEMKEKSEYDLPHQHDHFDQLTLTRQLKEGLDADPATRYEFLVNEFERELFNALKSVSDSEFDDETEEKALAEDEEFLEKLTEEVMPAKRDENGNPIQVVSMEEGAVSESDVLKERTFISDGLFIDGSLPPAVRIEAQSLLYQLKDGNNELNEGGKLAARRRLFEIFIQQRDYLKFSRDFANLESVHGFREEGDPLRWNNFRIESTDDMQSVLKGVEGSPEYDKFIRTAVKKGPEKVSEEEIHNETSSLRENFLNNRKDISPLEDPDGNCRIPSVTRAFVQQYGMDGEEDDGDSPLGRSTGDKKGVEEEIKDEIDDDSDDDDTEELLDLVDPEGRVWSGYLLDQDVVQKTTSGNRVASYRALVAIGNLRGTAGYGIGKGEKPADAVNGAFRAALKNLVHVDLYENSGLAHDVYGRYNSCIAYIRSTPSSRAMVASPFSQAILNLFGIGSASVKLLGRRDPYAKVMAIFDAIKKHQNIDEYSKARGKRYISEKWLRERGL